LNAGELISHRSYGHDCGAFAWLECDEEEHPDEKDGNDADGERDEEPGTPAGLRAHVLESDDVLGRGDGGGGTANVGSEGDTEDESFGEIRVGG